MPGADRASDTKLFFNGFFLMPTAFKKLPAGNVFNTKIKYIASCPVKIAEMSNNAGLTASLSAATLPEKSIAIDEAVGLLMVPVHSETVRPATPIRNIGGSRHAVPGPWAMGTATATATKRRWTRSSGQAVNPSQPRAELVKVGSDIAEPGSDPVGPVIGV